MKRRSMMLFHIIIINFVFIGIGLAQPSEPSMWPTPSTPHYIPDGFQLVYGDIIMPTDVLEGRSVYNNRPWPDGIVPYVFAPYISTDNRIKMLRAMSEWEFVAGVRFIPRTDEKDFIEIIEAGGNWSYVGRLGGKQQISIYDWGYKYIVMHELAHTLGVWHEQSRADRDTYVRIMWDNIHPYFRPNFNIQPGTTVGTYDFESIMHYPDWAFSINGQPTIVARPGYEQYQSKMGNIRKLTPLDIEGMRQNYPLYLLMNGGFEAGWVNWTGYDCTSQGFNQNTAHGAWAVLFTNSGLGGCTELNQTITREILGGEQYSFTIWARHDGSGTAPTVRVALSAEGDTPIQVSTPETLTTDWRCYTVSLFIPSGTFTTITPRVLFDTTAGTGKVVLDRAMLTRNTRDKCWLPKKYSPIYNGDFTTSADGWNIQNATATMIAGSLSVTPDNNTVGIVSQDTGMTVKNETQLRLNMHITNPNPTAVSVTVSIKDVEGGAGDYTCSFVVPGGTMLGDFAVVRRLGGNQDLGRMVVEYHFPSRESPLPLVLDDIVLSRVKDTFNQEGGECISPPEPGELYQAAFELNLTQPTVSVTIPIDVQYEHGSGEPDLGCFQNVPSVWYTFVAPASLRVETYLPVIEGDWLNLIAFSEKDGVLQRIGCQTFYEGLYEDTPDQPPLTFPTAAGTRYYIAASSSNELLNGKTFVIESAPNLIQNGGFDKGAAGWVVSSKPTDRLDDKVNCKNQLHLYALCHFRFQGGIGENTTLKQTLKGAKLAGWTFAAGQTYTLNAYLRGTVVMESITVNGIISYADGSTQTFQATPVADTQIMLSYWVSHDIELTRGDVAKIQLIIKSTATGRAAFVNVDNIALTLTADAPPLVRDGSQTLPLPPLPDGFRQ